MYKNQDFPTKDILAMSICIFLLTILGFITWILTQR